MSKHRTPLRYPGGKQRLAPFFLELLVENSLVGGHYVEPYAGGAGVAMELLLSNKIGHIHLNDSALPIYLFWKSVLHRSEELCRRIYNASLTVDEWKKRKTIVQDPLGQDELDVGFSVLYLNRCNRSGVISGGLIGGLEQKGTWKMDARFPRNELIRRIEVIASRKEAISLQNWDAEKFMLEYIPMLPENTLVYCDPPYFEKCGRLYMNHYKKDDHFRLAKVIQDKLVRKWVVSYDGVPDVLDAYSNRRTFLYDLQYNASRVYKGKEVFIFSDNIKIPTSSSLPYIDEAIDLALSS